MAKQLNIDMRFNADVSAAKAQLQSLQTSINQLTTSIATQGTQLGITPKIQEAQQAAVQLKTALSQSMNVETGKFDLSKFNSSLKSMNTDLSKLKTQLVNLGPSGQQTFMTLAQSIMTAEIPTKRISASLAQLGTTLKNTAKWQLSSSMLHGFMSAVQTSYRYAQDLNKSLNNIRIVTGESAEAMDQFAARANKAAKALSASTLDYTNAALIYYQQGLKGKDVEDRAEVTLKLANVSRQSAEVVSDQMTAIWNNFYDGSKSLEYYADVLTALGAATASSTDEIAGGLEKFAAIGDTIGLSYEYAAAALATITSNTRQSEEVVGTALKTIFARIQGLKLGETLEDGTELNKYSEALQAVGVHIFDANGELKNMDIILDETAAKWSRLSRDQQSALAQTVAGVRQYTQFIALMDNWNDGTTDSMKANLETISNSGGALQKQADIYAESWEAASKRVKASAEALYTSILDDDFFIELSNGLADLLDKIQVFVKSLGGVKGILLGLSGILLNTFSGAAAQGLENMVYNLRSFMGLAKKDAMNMKNQVANMMTNLGTGMQLTNQQQGSLTGAQQQVQLQNEINQLSSKWTDQQKAQAQNIMEMNRLYGEQVALLGEAADKANQQKQSSKSTMLEQSLGTVNQFNQSLQGIDEDIDISSGIIDQVNKLEKEFAEGKIKADAFKASMEDFAKQAKKQGFTGLGADLDRTSTYSQKTVGKKDFIEDSKEKRAAYAREDIINKRRYNESESKVNRGMRGVGNEEIEDYVRNAQNAKGATDKFAQGQETLKQATEEAKQKLQELNNASRSWSQTAVGVAQGMSSIGFGIQSLSSMFKTLTDDSASFSDKLLSAFTGLGMALPMLINGFNSLKTSIMGSNTVMTLAVALGQADVTTLNAQQLAKMTGMSIEEASQVLRALAISQQITEIALTEGVTDAEKAKQIAKLTGMSVEKAAMIIEKLRNGETLKSILLGELSIKSLAKKTWATIAHTVAQVADNVAVAIAKALAGDYSGLVLLGAMAVGIATAGLLVHAAAQEADNQKIAEANERLDRTTEAYEEATQRAKEFKETITSYEEAINSLKDLVSGTDEYTEALKKANKEAAKMIDMYPDIEYTVENGLIKISSADYNAYYKDLQKQQKMFDTMRIQDTASKLKAENIANESKYKKEFNKTVGAKFDEVSYYDSEGNFQTTDFSDKFFEHLQKLSYTDASQLLTGSKEEIQALIESFDTNPDEEYRNNMAYKYEDIAEKIFNMSAADKQATLDNIQALRDNTEALRAEIEANQQQKYGERFVAEHGTAEIYGAEVEIAKTKMDNIDWNSEKEGNQTSYAEYIDDMMDLYNNTEHLTNKSKTDAAMVAKIFGIDEGTFDGRELRVRQGDATAGESGTVYLTGDKSTGGYNSEKGTDLKMSIEEFDARAAIIGNKLTIAEGEIDALLKTAEGREKALKIAQEGGMYDYRDMLVTSDQTDKNADRTYDLMTVGQKEDLSKRFESNEITNETEENIKNYLNSVDSSIKQKVADKLLQMSNEQLNAMEEEDFEKLSKEETDAFYSRDIGRIAQDQANQYGLDADTLAGVAEGFRELGEAGDKAYENIKDNSDALVDAARVYMRMNGAIVDLKENYDDYSKTLKNIQQNQDPVAKGMAKGSESAKKLRKTLSDLLDTQEDMVDNNLLEAINPNDLEKAANGDIAAINRIRDAFIDLQVKGIAGIDAEKFKQELNSLEEGADINIDGEATLGLEEFISQLVLAEMMADASETDIENKLSGMGISCDAVQFYDTLAEAQAAAALTGGIIVDNLSFDTTQTTGSVDMEQNQTEATTEETVDVRQKAVNAKIPYQADADSPPEAVPVPGYVSYFTKNAKTNVKVIPTTTSATGMAQNVTNGAGKSGGKGKVAVVQGPKKKVGNSYNPNYGGGNSNGGGGGGSGGGGGGGGNSKRPKKPKRVKPTERKQLIEEVERYHEINQELEDLENSLEEISELKEEAWGANKLAAMDEEKKKLQEITASHKKYQAEIAKNLNDDRWVVETGFGAKIDSATGRITNYEELQQKWMEDWNKKVADFDAREQALEDRLAAAENAEDEDAKEKIEEEKETLADDREKYDKEYEEKRRAIEQYEETLNLSEEAERQLEDYLRQMRQLNYEKLEYTIELRVQVNENDMKDIELKLERLGEKNISNTKARLELILANADHYRLQSKISKEAIEQAKKDLENKKINESQYQSLVQEHVDNLQTIENDIRAAIEQIGDELSNAFDLADEEFDRQYEKFDQLIELTEHYKSIVILTKGEASYKEIGEILRTSQEVLKDRIEADKSEVAMWTERRIQMQQNISNASLTGEALKEAEEELQAIEEKEAEAKSQLMADIEQLGEYAREIFENEIELISQAFEEELFGKPLVSVIESLEMMRSKEEELLTTTNKMYETNKMIRDIEKDIEATTNNRAKQAYKEFQNKVKQKQEQGKLTKHELELLTAEYEITKAQIALEEAQNAKDTVRLTRDSEGNYGYVYTANQSNISQAEQALADAENNYYNTALEGMQKYEEQMYQHIQEWEEAIKETMLDQTLTEEQKQEKIKEINDTYNEILLQDQELFNISKAALEESSYDHQVDYNEMGIESAAKWFDESENYIEQMKGANLEYEANTKYVADSSSESFGEISSGLYDATEKSENLKLASQNLAEKFKGILIPAIDDATESWIKYNEQLKYAMENTDVGMAVRQENDSIAYSENYAQDIIDEYRKGDEADLNKIKRMATARATKQGEIDFFDYQAAADAARTRGDVAEEKAWLAMRDAKLEMMKNTDYTALIKSAIMNGLSLDSTYIQDLLKMRAIKISALGITNAQSNEDLIKELKGEKPVVTTTTTTTTTTQETKAPEVTETVKAEPSEEDIKNQAKYIYDRIMAGAWGTDAGTYWPNRRAAAKAELGEAYIDEAFDRARDVINGKRASFATGGYTGAWGPEGKLAILHEKELVLNAEDTKNFLSATNILREISQMLDRDALIASLGAINLKAMTLNTPADQVLQQEVTIHADFPNVTDHNEIELAIDNLINAASQYAYKN